jgi:pimeloyl-ACP methyl ester carboxylesterase
VGQNWLRFSLLAVLLIFTLPELSYAVAQPVTLGPLLSSCAIGRTKVFARCGTFGIYEDRKFRTGRVIALRVVILKGAHPTDRAVVFIAGGPGASAVSAAAPIADGLFEKELIKLRNYYDIMLLDNRGMGQSNPFNCDLAPQSDPQSYFSQLWPDKALAKCRASSALTHNLNLYNTLIAVDDLNDVRRGLGYRKIVLDGGSYGTFLALNYIRRHPDSVESSILDGVAPPHFQPPPGAPSGTQIALNDLFKRCRADSLCSRKFPQLPMRFAEIVHRFDKGPMAITVRRATSTHSETFFLSKEVFVDQLRQVLDQPENAASVPFIIERAFYRDYGPLAQMINAVSQGLAHALDWGAFFSYTCADEIPFLSDREIRNAAAFSFAGDSRFRAQQRACKVWGVRPANPGIDDPVRSEIPILVISGRPHHRRGVAILKASETRGGAWRGARNRN